jgi:hypothetical protein
MRSLLSILLVFFAVSVKAHPFYVSIATLHYNQESRALEITLKVFTDDLEASIKNLTKKTLNLGFDNQLKDSKSILETYCTETINISNSNKTQIMNFLGFENEDDVTYLYFEVGDISAPLDVSCTFLTETFDEQVTIFNLECGEEKKTVYTNKNSSSFNEVLNCQ